jgi:tRNA nucleotidyltransferase (CCA-adding enzyme)
LGSQALGAIQADTKLATMDIYEVGGAVRDRLMGQPVHDRDWVVVGASPEALLNLGYTPVGKDFPVFLHPQTRDEVALARTERKTAPGYHGFAFHAAPDVTLEQDLLRRDLTINAMARSDQGEIIDPYGGQRDLEQRVLRHVSPAFAEDPVRILRLARFAARWPDFAVAPETMELMRGMVNAGEVDALVAERVWQELSKGLMETRPSRMLETLQACGALARLLPEVNALWGVPQRADYHPEVDTGIHLLMVLDTAAQLQAPLPTRWACLCHDLGKGTTPAQVLPRHLGHEQRSAELAQGLGKRLKVSAECQELAHTVALEHGNIHRSLELSPAAVLRLLERCDALRRPERFAQALLACECDARGRGGDFADKPYRPSPKLRRALQCALQVNTAEVAQQAKAAGLSGPRIGEAIHAARVTALSGEFGDIQQSP